MVLPQDDMDKENPKQPTEGQVSPLPDWLKSASPSGEAQPAQPLPDWLQASGPSSTPSPSEPPAWLAAEAQPVRPPSAGAPPRPAEPVVSEPEDELAALRSSMAAPGVEETPDWLAEITPAGSPSAAEPASADMPDWLREASAAEPAAPAEMPDWLSEVAPAEPASADAPDWLKEAAAAEPAATPAQPAEPTPAVSAEMPDWLSEVAPAEPASADAPDWLKEVSAAEPAAAPAQPTAAAPAEMPDWLSEVAPAEPASADAPDWLKEAAAAEPAAPSALPPEPTDAIPAEALDWLADVPPTDLASAGMSDLLKELSPSEPAAPPAQPLEPTPGTPAEDSDWMSAFGSGEPSPGAPEAVPDWMAEIMPSEPVAPSTPPSEPGPAASMESPDWLSALASTEPPAEPAGPVEVAPATSAKAAPVEPDTSATSIPSDAIDWLSGLTPLEPAEASSEKPQEPAAAPTTEAPEWLSSMQEPGTLPDAAPAPAEPVAGPPSSADKPNDDLFDWMSTDIFGDASSTPIGAGEDLLGLTGDLFAPAPDQAAEEAKTVEEAETAEEAAPELEALPEWWQSIQPSAPEVAAGTSSETPSDLLGQIDSLRFDAIVGSEAQSGSSEPEKIGALKDVVGVIQPEVVFEGGSLKGGGLSGEVIITDEQNRRIERLQRLLDAEKEETAISPQRRLALPLVRWLTAVVLAAAIAAPLLMEISVLPAPQPSPGATDAEQLLAALPDESTVLVAFEYEPESAAELQPLAVALLKDIGVHENVTIYAVSTRPMGPAMADKAFDSAFPAESAAPEGAETEESGAATPAPETDAPAQERSGWVNLGYVPGGANGISELVIGSPRGIPSRLAFDYQGHSTGITQAGLIEQPPALIVIVSAKAEDLRPWVEQAGQAMKTPILAATSAGSSPLALPYQKSGQVAAVLIGVSDTLSYQSLANDGPDPTLVATWNAQALGGLAAALVIIVGGILYGLTSWRKPQEQSR